MASLISIASENPRTTVTDVVPGAAASSVPGPANYNVVVDDVTRSDSLEDSTDHVHLDEITDSGATLDVLKAIKW